MDPPLSTVRVPKKNRRNLHENASRALASSSHDFQQRILPTEFVIRGTVRHL